MENGVGKVIALSNSLKRGTNKKKKLRRYSKNKVLKLVKLRIMLKLIQRLLVKRKSILEGLISVMRMLVKGIVPRRLYFPALQ